MGMDYMSQENLQKGKMEMQIKKIENCNLNYRGELKTSFLNLKIVFGDPTFVNRKDSTFV